MIIKQKLRLTIPSHKIKIVRGPYLGICRPLMVRGPLVGNQWTIETLYIVFRLISRRAHYQNIYNLHHRRPRVKTLHCISHDVTKQINLRKYTTYVCMYLHCVIAPLWSNFVLRDYYFNILSISVHAVSCTHLGRQREPSVKTLRSPLSWVLMALRVERRNSTPRFASTPEPRNENINVNKYFIF